jgi:hypothetical protein
MIKGWVVVPAGSTWRCLVLGREISKYVVPQYMTFQGQFKAYIQTRPKADNRAPCYLPPTIVNTRRLQVGYFSSAKLCQNIISTPTCSRCCPPLLTVLFPSIKVRPQSVR